MSRDSFFGEDVLWRGRPKVVRAPRVYAVFALVCFVSSAIATTSAVVVATALGERPTGLLGFALWMATLGLASFQVPRLWRSELEYVLTEGHVLVRRGRFRRMIDRRSISYARIVWDPRVPGVGDLELVRAVPTGALRRRLSISLTGIAAPDRVWSLVRGVVPHSSLGDGHRVLAQRLDEGERVLWSGHPEGGYRAWLPTTPRALVSLGIAGLMGVSAAMSARHAVGALRLVERAGLERGSISFVFLVLSLSLSIVLMTMISLGIVYVTAVRPARLAAHTSYLVTNRRVLIQRTDEELHLDRARVVDVIDRPSQRGLFDVYLVLDGPHARALAASGAFGEASTPGLSPVLLRVADPAELRARLMPGSAAPASGAAAP